MLVALLPPPPHTPSPASHPDTMVTRCCHDEEGERCPGATGIMAFDDRWLQYYITLLAPWLTD